MTQVAVVAPVSKLVVEVSAGIVYPNAKGWKQGGFGGFEHNYDQILSRPYRLSGVVFRPGGGLSPDNFIKLSGKRGMSITEYLVLRERLPGLIPAAPIVLAGSYTGKNTAVFYDGGVIKVRQDDPIEGVLYALTDRVPRFV